MKKIIRKIKSKLSNNVDINDLKKRGLKIGDNVHIGPGCIIDYSHCWLIEIGDNCTFAPRVHVLAHDASTKNKLDYTRIEKVIIGNNTFIGAGAIILPGVSIGNDVIIGAGSIVTKDIESGSVAVGNPAKVIQSTENYLKKQEQIMRKSVKYDSVDWTIHGNITPDMKKQMNRELDQKVGYIK